MLARNFFIGSAIACLLAIGIGIIIGHFGIQPTCDARGFVDDDPLDFRRASFVVHNMEESLKFYEYGLGMTRIYDKVLIAPEGAETVEESDSWRRLVMLRMNNEFIGVLGLLEYTKPYKGGLVPIRPDPLNDYFRTGDALLIFTSPEPAADRISRALEANNTAIQEPWKLEQYPNYAGTGFISLNRTNLVDPDGIVVEVIHILDGLND